MDLTTTLKKSISYEQSKSSLFNLNNHGREDLEPMLELLDKEKQEIENEISYTQSIIDRAEDMDEGVKATLNKGIAADRKKLETYLAWRNLFWAAWDLNGK